MALPKDQLRFLKRQLVDENPNPDVQDYFVGCRALSTRQIYGILEGKPEDRDYQSLCSTFGEAARRSMQRANPDQGA